jgi:hypothetical protein
MLSSSVTISLTESGSHQGAGHRAPGTLLPAIVSEIIDKQYCAQFSFVGAGN